MQISGPPGRRTLLITASTANRVIDSHRTEIEVLPADTCAPLPILDVRGDPTREATGFWNIRNADDVHRLGTYYEWHYGAKSPMVTRIPRAVISYADLLDPNERFRAFRMRLVVCYPDQSRREAKRSVTVWNRYALAKERGIVQPRVVYDFRASPEGDHLVGRARIFNRDDEYIHFTSKQIQWLLNDPDKLAGPGRARRVNLSLPPKSSLDIEHKILFKSLPPNAFGFAVILLGETRNGHTAHVAAYFEHHMPHANGVRVISDPELLATLTDLRCEAYKGARRRFTRADLEELACKREEAGEARLQIKVASLFKASLLKVHESAQALTGSFEGLQCLPDQTPPEEGLACQLTDEWGWVSVPGRFPNARKGDILLSPGSGGPILGVLRHVSPPQTYSHSAIMIENYYKIRHSTASEDWLADQGSDSFTLSGSDGIDPKSLKYIWPGTIDQTAENAMEGEWFQDPDGKTDEFGDIRRYSLNAVTNGGLDPGNEIIDPLVLKPNPLKELEHEWVRPNLHRVADAAKKILGHYRFYAFTDAAICDEVTGDYVAPTQSGWWASGTRPTVCSALIWAAAASLKDPEVRLEGKGPFTKSSDIEATDVGGDVDFRTRDGLYLYKEGERQVAGNWLYDYFYNLAYQIAGACGVIMTDAASDTANQICNAFAFDWTGWSDTYEDEAKDSDRWKNPGQGRAVSPDNMMNWDEPTSLDGNIALGLYGFTEPLIYRQPYLEYRRISRWVRVPTKGILDGEVLYKGVPVGGAIVNVGGNSLLSNEAGEFTIELPEGEYHVQAGKVITVGYAEGNASATVVAGENKQVVVHLQDPPEHYRRLTICGTMLIEDYEHFGSNEYATRHLGTYSDVGPYGTHDEVPWTEKMGGEIRVVLILKIDWKIDLSIDVNWHVQLYEGTSEETTDLDGERWGMTNVPKDEVKRLYISVWNSEEDDPEDRADITFDLTNSVRP
ncbi:MAG: hypothetical protein JSW47_10250 [Phycisphaerales bacterium]|nr:MAG: hypothetical protein JSW47_10250 [Phycisphaerales bacterium]